MCANEVETKEKEKLPEIKKLTTCMRNIMNLILARLLMIALLTLCLGIRRVNK